MKIKNEGSEDLGLNLGPLVPAVRIGEATQLHLASVSASAKWRDLPLGLFGGLNSIIPIKHTVHAIITTNRTLALCLFLHRRVPLSRGPLWYRLCWYLAFPLF